MFINHMKRLFNRPPRAGGRKEVPMPVPDAQPAEAPKVPEDLSGPLSTLIDAMRQLAESQKTLTEAVKQGSGVRVQGSAEDKSISPLNPEPRTLTPPVDIGGDPIGGQRPSAVVDYSRMSPVQQITLGLRDSRNKAPSAGAD